jgi:hypothetical protein
MIPEAFPSGVLFQNRTSLMLRWCQVLSERSPGTTPEVERFELQLLMGTQNTSSNTYIFLSWDAEITAESLQRIFLYTLSSSDRDAYIRPG